MTARRVRTAARDSALAAGAASAANAALYLSAKAAGARFVVDDGSALRSIDLAQVIASSAVPVLVASAIASAVRSRRWFRTLQVVGVVLTVGSLGAPVSMGVGLVTKVALAAMHLSAGAAFLLVTERARPFEAPTRRAPTAGVATA